MDYREIAEKNQVLKVRVGSHLFGTSTPESDEDFEGIFMPDRSLVFGFGRCKEVDLGVVDKDDMGRNTADAIDYKVREYRDFCRLALQNNPNIMNVLFANDENTVVCTEFGKRLKEMAPCFPHMGCIQRYKGYAISQLKKMEIKPQNRADLMAAKMILEGYSLKDPKKMLVELSGNNYFNDLGPGKHIKVGDILLERSLKVKDALGRISSRLERVSARAELWDKYGFDTKFAANLIQILMQGRELVSSGVLSFPLEGAGVILDIKRGAYEAGRIREMAESLQAEIDLDAKAERIPAKPKYEKIESFVVKEVEKWLMI